MKVAAIDLGTNTFLLLIAEMTDGRLTVLHDEAQIVRLGQNVNETRAFHPEALRRADICLQNFAHTIKRFAVTNVLACATSAARDVKNKQDLFDLGACHGIPIEIISGPREAELTFSGTFDSESKPVESISSIAVIDVGGGSTELIVGDSERIIERTSVDVGAVRLTEMFVTAHPIVASEMLSMEKYIKKLFDSSVSAASQPDKHKISKLIAVAGTPTTLAALDLQTPYDSHLIEGYRLSLTAMKTWVDTLCKMSIPERQALAGMEAKRADVLVAGSLILSVACEKLGFSGVHVSVRGLRFGLAKFLFTQGLR